MTELSIALPPAAPVSAARPTTNTSTSSRAAPARDGTPHPNASPFEDALALELGLATDDSFLPGLGTHGSRMKAGSGRNPGEDAAQAANAADGPLAAGSSGIPPLPPALASLSPPAIHGEFRALSPAFAPPGSEPAGLASDSRGVPLAKASAATRAAAEFHIAAAAADFVPSGKLSPATTGEIRRDIAFDQGPFEHQESAPPQPAATHAGINACSPVQAASAPAVAVEAPVGGRGWDQGLGDKLVWMASQKQQVAELQLNPPDLGPLKITLTLKDDQASAQFVSAHAPVREAIETAMPRLREMLADSGITLGNASVSTDAFPEQAQPQQERRAYPAPPGLAAAEQASVTHGERTLRRALGLVDTFA